MKTKILLDLDGVIANFCRGFLTFLNEHYGCTLNPNQDPQEYDLSRWGCGVDKIDLGVASLDWILHNGFERLPAYQGAKEFARELLSNYNVYIVTARIGDWEQKFSADQKARIKKNTFKWLKRLGIPSTKLYFARDKVQFCQEKGISIMVEDKLETALNASKAGIHTVLMNRGYNGSKTNRTRVYRAFDYIEALDLLRRLTDVKG